MTEIEIALARGYLEASGHDAVAALIRSVKDLAGSRRLLAAREARGDIRAWSDDRERRPALDQPKVGPSHGTR